MSSNPQVTLRQAGVGDADGLGAVRALELHIVFIRRCFVGFFVRIFKDVLWILTDRREFFFLVISAP